MKKWIIKYWFIAGLVILTAVTMADRHEWTVSAGRWLKSQGGPDLVIFFVFLFSGLSLDASLLRKGLRDFKATLAALIIIFVFSPLLAWLFQYLPLNIQVITGLCLVSAMPCTLSSGVVMTDGAGGNMAHALFVTIVANALAVFTIPVVLSLLISNLGEVRSLEIDKFAIMAKIALLALFPLAIGMFVQNSARNWIAPLQPKVQVINQCLILAIVWMSMCKSRTAIVTGGSALPSIVLAAFVFHLVLVIIAFAVTGISGIGPGRRESVIFMGGQKTLPLSVILQVSLFPDYGLALAMCVAHHIIHLIMDAYLMEKIKVR